MTEVTFDLYEAEALVASGSAETVAEVLKEAKTYRLLKNGDRFVDGDAGHLLCFLEEYYTYALLKGEEVVKQGATYDIKEYLEEEIEKRANIYPSLETMADEGELFVYLHTDTYEDLEEEELEELEGLGINDSVSQETTKAILDFVGLELKKA